MGWREEAAGSVLPPGADSVAAVTAQDGRKDGGAAGGRTSRLSSGDCCLLVQEDVPCPHQVLPAVLPRWNTSLRQVAGSERSGDCLSWPVCLRTGPRPGGCPVSPAQQGLPVSRHQAVRLSLRL